MLSLLAFTVADHYSELQSPVTTTPAPNPPTPAAPTVCSPYTPDFEPNSTREVSKPGSIFVSELPGPLLLAILDGL